jgi:hypothetical protein
MLLPFDEGAWWTPDQVQAIFAMAPATIGQNAAVTIIMRGGAQIVLPVDGGHSAAVAQVTKLVELVNKAARA